MPTECHGVFDCRSIDLFPNARYEFCSLASSVPFSLVAVRWSGDEGARVQCLLEAESFFIFIFYSPVALSTWFDTNGWFGCGWVVRMAYSRPLSRPWFQSCKIVRWNLILRSAIRTMSCWIPTVFLKAQLRQSSLSLTECCCAQSIDGSSKVTSVCAWLSEWWMCLGFDPAASHQPVGFG